MKKSILLLLFIFTFFVFKNTSNAMVPLCGYTSVSDSSSEAYITIEGSNMIFTASNQGVIYIPDSAWYEYVNPFVLVPEIGTMMGEAENVANNGGSMWKFSVDFSKMYRVDGSADTQTASVYIYDQTTGQRFMNLFECPSQIAFGTFNFDGTEQAAFMIGTADTLPVSSDNAAGMSSVYSLTYGRFGDNDAPSLYQPNMCMTDTDRINQIANYYTFDSNIPREEIILLSKIYNKRGYDTVASQISQTYAPGSDCYENNPSLQSTYDDLKSKVDSYLTNYSGQYGVSDITDCRSIIGDPNEAGSFAYYLNYTIKFIQYLGPILVIVLSTVDQVKAVTSGDADEIKKSTQKNIKRLIFAVLLFFIATIINILLHTFGFESCNIGNGGVG